MSFKKLFSRKFILTAFKFGLVGLLNTFIGMGVDILFTISLAHFLNLTREDNLITTISTIVSYIFGGFNSYLCNKYFTFKSNEKGSKEFKRFAIVFVLQLAMYLGLKYLFINLGMEAIVAIIVVTGIVTFLSFFAHFFFSFASAGKKILEENDSNNDQDVVE